MTTRRLPLLFTLLLIIGVRPAHARPKSEGANCDRQCLGQVLDAYFQSIMQHNPAVLPVAKHVRFTENGAELKVGQGLWQRGGKASYRLDAIDPEDGQVASQAVVEDGDQKALILVRLKVEKKKVTEIETLVVVPGVGQRSNPDGLSGTTPTVYTELVPKDERNTRQQVVDAANAYFDALSNRGTPEFKAPPIASEAFRAENGVQTSGVSRGGRAPVSLADSLKSSPAPAAGRGGGAHMVLTDRRFPVVDLEHGIALGIAQVTLHLPPGANDGPPLHSVAKPNGIRLQVLSECFKVYGDQIHQIQAVMLDLDDPNVTTPGWTAH